MTAFKFPKGKFMPIDNCSPAYILERYDMNAFIFRFIAFGIQLKSDSIVMPVLQFSKCVRTDNAIQDNGRILSAGYVEIWLTEVDLSIIAEQYDVVRCICTDVLCTGKDYLPRWFTDYVFELFEAKTTLKGGDPVLYALAKARLNSLYGMLCQKPVKPLIEEDYLTGEYRVKDSSTEEEYQKYVNRYNSVMNYQYGIWVTAYALKNLISGLGACVSPSGVWLYSDTDSCYAYGWDKDKIKAYNEGCKERLRANGYGAVLHNGREYWLGVAEFDGHYKEFVCVGAKRYAVRKDDDTLKITVAGVPKKGAQCLNGDLKNFKNGFVFSGDVTGKKTHFHIIVPEIYIDEEGNECGDSIDLESCDYLLSSVHTYNWEDILIKEVKVQIYDGY